MTTDQWQTVFDASQKPLPLDSMLAATPFLAVAIVFWLFREHPIVRGLYRTNPLLRGRSGNTVFPLVVGTFALVWTILAVVFQGWRYVAAQSALRDGTAQVVEGPAENFHPMPVTGHDSDRFDVAGVHFEYSDYEITAGFNNTRSHGGPIGPDSYVRIHYIQPKSPVIVRLEIRVP